MKGIHNRSDPRLTKNKEDGGSRGLLLATVTAQAVDSTVENVLQAILFLDLMHILDGIMKIAHER
jgi:hypothetical protein